MLSPPPSFNVYPLLMTVVLLVPPRMIAPEPMFWVTAVPLPKISVPPLLLTVPVNVFVPASVRVPVPLLVSEPLPLMAVAWMRVPPPTL